VAQCDEPRYSGVDHIRSTGRSGSCCSDREPFRQWAETVVHPQGHVPTPSRHRKETHGGDIKATKRGETERQESGCGSQAQTDAETAAEKDADCAWKASGEIEKGEVSAGTQQIGRYA
jgi:hypothetical protein